MRIGSKGHLIVAKQRLNYSLSSILLNMYMYIYSFSKRTYTRSLLVYIHHVRGISEREIQEKSIHTYMCMCVCIHQVGKEHVKLNIFEIHLKTEP